MKQAINPRIDRSNYLKFKSFLFGSVMTLIAACQVEVEEIIGDPRTNPDMANVCSKAEKRYAGVYQTFEIVCYNEHGLLVTNKVTDYNTGAIEVEEAYTYDKYFRLKAFNDLKANKVIEYTYEPFDEATHHQTLSHINPALANTCRISDESPQIAECRDGYGLHVKTRTLNPDDGSIDSEVAHVYDKKYQRIENDKISFRYCTHNGSFAKNDDYDRYCDTFPLVKVGILTETDHSILEEPSLPWLNSNLGNLCREIIDASSVHEICHDSHGNVIWTNKYSKVVVGAEAYYDREIFKYREQNHRIWEYRHYVILPLGSVWELEYKYHPYDSSAYRHEPAIK